MPPWKRTYWAVFAANLVTAVGMMSFLPFFPSVLEDMGLEDRDEIAAWTGAIFGAAPLAAAFMGPVWGSIGDRFGRKMMVLRAMLAISLFVGCMGFVSTPAALLALRLGQGVFSGFVPPSITLVSVSAPRAVQGRVAGSLQASLAAGSIAGPLMGAWVQAVWGIQAIFLVVAALSLLGALLVAFLAHEEAALRATLERWSPTSLLRGIWDDLRLVVRNPRIRAALIVLFCVQFGLGATNPLLELLVDDLGFVEQERRRLTAYLFTAMAAASLVSTGGWGRWGDRVGHERMLFASATAAAIVLGLHAAILAYPLLLGVRILLGLTASGPPAASSGVAATETPIERRGGAFGAMFSARAFAISLGSLTGGALASILGIRILFAAAGGGVLVALGFAQLVRSRAERGVSATPPTRSLQK